MRSSVYPLTSRAGLIHKVAGDHGAVILSRAHEDRPSRRRIGGEEKTQDRLAAARSAGSRLSRISTSDAGLRQICACVLRQSQEATKMCGGFDRGFLWPDPRGIDSMTSMRVRQRIEHRCDPSFHAAGASVMWLSLRAVCDRGNEVRGLRRHRLREGHAEWLPAQSRIRHLRRRKQAPSPRRESWFRPFCRASAMDPVPAIRRTPGPGPMAPM